MVPVCPMSSTTLIMTIPCLEKTVAFFSKRRQLGEKEREPKSQEGYLLVLAGRFLYEWVFWCHGKSLFFKVEMVCILEDRQETGRLKYYIEGFYLSTYRTISDPPGTSNTVIEIGSHLSTSGVSPTRWTGTGVS